MNQGDTKVIPVDEDYTGPNFEEIIYGPTTAPQAEDPTPVFDSSSVPETQNDEDTTTPHVVPQVSRDSTNPQIVCAETKKQVEANLSGESIPVTETEPPSLMSTLAVPSFLSWLRPPPEPQNQDQGNLTSRPSATEEIRPDTEEKHPDTENDGVDPLVQPPTGCVREHVFEFSPAHINNYLECPVVQSNKPKEPDQEVDLDNVTAFLTGDVETKRPGSHVIPSVKLTIKFSIPHKIA